MQSTVEQLRPYLRDFDLTGLFVEGLGWDHYQTEPLTVRVDDRDYTLKPVAEKAGFAVYECGSGGERLPEYPVRRRIETQAAKRNFEHLIVFVDAARTVQKWQWVKREAGRPPACREQDFTADQSGEPVLQRLQEIVFTLEDEARGIGVSDVTGRVRKAFDVERITKRFYDRFRTELTAFENFIDGIAALDGRKWYASLMLNRMMFVYFIQKRGFLDNDPDYLRARLRKVQSKYGNGRFESFYRIFLLRLFHEGLGQPETQRDKELAEHLGKVPFLNGGLFDVHDLERDNPDIAIPDEAFERVFDFFDAYTWHLDDRPGRADNEINPDVLGYIFEKYVNQKQMGAYYTKEDITGYIARNTVIPFLFDAAKKECPVRLRAGRRRLAPPPRRPRPLHLPGRWPRHYVERPRGAEPDPSRITLGIARGDCCGHRRRIKAWRLEHLRAGRVCAPHGDLARSGCPSAAIRGSAREACIGRSAGYQ